MATRTLGSAATNTLTAVLFSQSTVTLLPADLATVALSILDDQNVTHPVINGSFVREGMLFVPGRGVLKILPGDFVATDPATGWPILLSARAAAGASWVHS